MPNFAVRLSASLAGVAIVTVVGARLLPGVNATTIGFAYLLLVLVIASTWGFIEAAVASIAATLSFNFFFFQPVGTLTIADPANWAALFSFLATSPDREPPIRQSRTARPGGHRAKAGRRASVYVQPLHSAHRRW